MLIHTASLCLLCGNRLQQRRTKQIGIVARNAKSGTKDHRLVPARFVIRIKTVILQLSRGDDSLVRVWHLHRPYNNRINVMPNPLTRLADAYEQAKAAHADWPEACCLATADASGMPAARMVLFRAVHPEGDDAGVTFFTNYNSPKSAELAANPRAAICIYWHPIQTQVRLSGPVVKASEEESDAYFATRPRQSQVGAWASEQSSSLARFEDLVEQVKAMEERFRGTEVPRPPHWGGWRIIAQRVEFWTEGPYRLHKRKLYTKQADGAWAMSLLNP